MKQWSNQSLYTLTTSIILGVLIGHLNIPYINNFAQIITTNIMNLFKLISLPIVFLSIITAISKIDALGELSFIGKTTIKYTILTTTIASFIALIIYMIIQPSRSQINVHSINETNQINNLHININTDNINIIPSNIMQPFLENNILSIIILSILLGLCISSLPTTQKSFFNNIFDHAFSLCMEITQKIVYFLPAAILAFTITAINDTKSGTYFYELMYYLLCIVLANLTQAIIILPIILIFAKVSPKQLFIKCKDTLLIAFFTKSSAAALPSSIDTCVSKLEVPQKIANFTLPICTTINMNACAAFIVITVLFVIQENHITVELWHFIIITLFSILAAIGNACIPMGCYYMSWSLLLALNIPLEIMTIILPFYIILDMLETAVNVWSDICITKIIATKSYNNGQK